MKTLTLNQLIHTLPKRATNSHKGNYGRVLLIGGNENMGGAIIMAAKAAVCSGAGLTTVATDKANLSALHSHLPEAMWLDWSNHEQLHDKLQQTDVVLMGCGMGLNTFSEQLLDVVLEQLTSRHTLILDGDAITLFARAPQMLKSVTLVTPHQREWQRLSGLEIAQQTEANNLAKLQLLPLHLILKKHGTELYFRDEEPLRIDVGTPAMATGGMGDTLAGMIAGFVAQFPQHFQQAVASAVYLHSHLAEKLAHTHHVVLPTDILSTIQTEMKTWI